MINSSHPNIEMIKVVALQLGDLIDDVAFLGGAAVGLLITDTGMRDIRPTKDVDVIVEVASRLEYRKLETRLRQLGFKNSMLPESPICRWEVNDILVDVMPTDETILGFSNKWYLDALRTADDKRLDDLTIRLVTGP